MDYFSILNLDREPFSNSPDPDYFYQSQEHLDCLQKLELSLHLRRGLNAIIGDVGTGKTTLCRQLIRKFAQRKEMETHLILDPQFKDSSDFLGTVAKLLCGRRPPENSTDWQIKEFIKHSLFRKGVDQKRTAILIIDEGQKIPEFCLEILREFLNYETNEYKLLQIVIFAQQEFEATIRRHPNFADRINLYHQLKPLSFADTRRMIRFRLEKSGSSPQHLDLFTWPALWAIFRISGGYPRKIIHICHHCILSMIIQNRRQVGFRLVRRCAARIFPADRRSPARIVAAATAVGLLAAAGLWHWAPELTRQLKAGFRGSEVSRGIRVESVEEGAGRKSSALSADTKPSVAAESAAAQEAPSPALDRTHSAAPPPSIVEAGEVSTPAEATGLKAELPETPFPALPPGVVLPAGPDPGSQVPQTLGRVSLKLNETLSGLVHRVYGNYSARHFRFIAMANPHIEDPDKVIAGQPIVLPAISVQVKPLNKETWWVKIVEKKSLEEGVEALRGFPESGPPVRMIPVWRPQNGLRFLIILKQLFTTEAAAQSQLELLPSPYISTGLVQKTWGDPAVFFADPFTVK